MQWDPAPFSPLPLRPGQIDVWRARLDRQADSLGDLATVLSCDELQRAARFRLTRDRNQFVLRRGLLRTVLSLYLSGEPREIRFTYGRYDKPFLNRHHHQTPLSFNVTHAREMVLYAVTSRNTVGVDVEFVEPLPDIEGVAGKVFSRRELNLLHGLPESERPLAFFTGWTRKEAYLKAVGAGLTRPPDQVEVYLGSSGTTKLPIIEGKGGKGRFWRIETVVPGAGCVGAVAAEGDDWWIRWLDWPVGGPTQMEHS